MKPKPNKLVAIDTDQVQRCANCGRLIEAGEPKVVIGRIDGYGLQQFKITHLYGKSAENSRRSPQD